MTAAQRRFDGWKPTERGHRVDLKVNHPAVVEGVTIFPNRRTVPGRDSWALKSGFNSKKIGRVIAKGRWRGSMIYTLTLEERATCPRSCQQWRTCYGSSMNWAHRQGHGPKLEARLWLELASLQREHARHGFMVRLHVLGDFYSVEYVYLWQRALAAFPAMRIWGYTARQRDSEIGGEILWMAMAYPKRCVVRFSDQPQAIFHSRVETGRVDCCATCALCWSTERPIVFVRH